MPRRPSFRRDTELQAEVRRLNKLVQNKQSRIRKNKGLEVQDIDTVQYKDFSSRKEIERYQRQMEKFLDRRADFTVENQKGVELRYSEVQEVEKTIRRVNLQKKKQWEQVKDLPYKHRGMPTGLTVADQANPKTGMGDPKFGDLKELQFDPNRFRSKKEFDEFRKNKGRVYSKGWMERMNTLYRDNYVKALENNLGPMSQALRDKISQMSPDEFAKMYYTENNANIDFIYEPLAMKARVAELERVWGV